MVKAIYAGSFDPFTKGHLHLIQRATVLFDEVIVLISHNHQKQYTLTKEERVQTVQEAVSNWKNVRVVVQDGGLTVEAAKQLGATVLLRGVRNSQDLELEKTLAYHNHRLDEKIETVLLMSEPAYEYVSSTMVKELAKFGGEFDSLVPESVAKILKKIYEGQEFQQMKLQERSE